jgi:hypothetical protein
MDFLVLEYDRKGENVGAKAETVHFKNGSITEDLFRKEEYV